MIKVLVVDDSPVIREFLVHLLARDPELLVVGTASDGQEAIAAVTRYRPDIITMDITMPRMNGFDATRRIMETLPTPIVIVSANWTPGEVTTTFHALEAGALMILQRPAGHGHPDHEAMTADLILKIKLMAEIKVFKRPPQLPGKQPLAPAPIPSKLKAALAQADIRVVAMGASTGGPAVIEKILSGLPAEFAVPILIVQHIAAGFSPGLAEWLGNSTPLAVRIARQHDPLLPGLVYLPPDDFHMGVDPAGRLVLSQDAPEHGTRPSVSFLFRSVANAYGNRAVGILLTGMGTDGSRELKLMNERGAVTIVQDKASAVVPGMTEEAIRLGGATYVCPPDKIIAMLTSLVRATSGIEESRSG